MAAPRPATLEVVGLEPENAGELRALWDDFEPWAGRDVGDVRAGIRGSNVVLGVRSAGELVAAARLVTDGTFYGTVSDVIVAAERRGRGTAGLSWWPSSTGWPTDLTVLDLRCREGLVPFSERFGFVVHDPTIEVDGREESFVKMKYESPE